MAEWRREHGMDFRFITEASLNLADDRRAVVSRANVPIRNRSEVIARKDARRGPATPVHCDSIPPSAPAARQRGTVDWKTETRLTL